MKTFKKWFKKYFIQLPCNTFQNLDGWFPGKMQMANVNSKRAPKDKVNLSRLVTMEKNWKSC